MTDYDLAFCPVFAFYLAARFHFVTLFLFSFGFGCDFSVVFASPWRLTGNIHYGDIAFRGLVAALRRPVYKILCPTR